MSLKLRAIDGKKDVERPSAVSSLKGDLSLAARLARQHAIASIFKARCGNPAAALSSAELLSCLYGAELNIWPKNLGDPLRDRFVLSKSQAAPALYGIGAKYNFCGIDAAFDYGRNGSPYRDCAESLDAPWVEPGTAAPGKGFSIAVSLALSLKLEDKPARVYSLVGDAELLAGSVWESAICAAHHGLDNLCILLDCSRSSGGDRSTDSIQLEPLAAKWRAFNWAVAEIDGHDIDEILRTFHRAASTTGRPAIIIAHTISGKGVPALEAAPSWDGSNELTRLQAEESLRALGVSDDDLKDHLRA